MKDGILTAYEQIIEEQTKEHVVKTNLKTGANSMGDLKKEPIKGELKNAKKPVEGDAKINPGHGDVKKSVKESTKEIKNMMPKSKFDELYNSQVIEEEEFNAGDDSPLEMGGDGEFDDDTGDFPSDGDIGDDSTGEEVDIATELRMVIDRLTEVAERLGAYDEEMDDADAEAGGLGGEGDIGSDLGSEPELAPESVQAKLKAFPNKAKQMQGRNNKVKSKFCACGAKKAKTMGGPGKGAADGKLGPARKTTLGPKMSQKAEVKGTMGKTGAGIFDNV